MKERNSGIIKFKKRGRKPLKVKNLVITFERVGKALFEVAVTNSRGEPVIPARGIRASSVNGVITINILDLPPNTHEAVFFKTGMYAADVRVHSVEGEENIARECWYGTFTLTENQAMLWSMNMVAKKIQIAEKQSVRIANSIKNEYRRLEQLLRTNPQLASVSSGIIANTAELFEIGEPRADVQPAEVPSNTIPPVHTKNTEQPQLNGTAPQEGRLARLLSSIF